MNDVFNRYMNSFLHPKDTQLFLREGNVVSLFAASEPGFDQEKISFEEGMGVSWVFAFIQAFYAVLIIYLGIEYFQIESRPSFLRSYRATTVKIFFIIFEVILFPIGFWFYVKFWSGVVNLFTQLFDLDESVKVRSEKMVVHAMSAHVFLIFPFFGKFFAQICQLVYLYYGMRLNLGLNVLQSLAVLIFPLFILFISLSLMILSLVMLFAGF